MRSLAVLLAAAAVLPILVGCGDSAAAPRLTAEARSEWAANTSVVIGQLRNDVAATQAVPATPAASREALEDESALYALLIAYTDLAGCRHIVASAGAPPEGGARVGEPLGAACVHLERAASLFSTAAQRHDARPLTAATREARRALPALVRAAAALARVTQRR